MSKKQVIENMIMILGECDPENIDDFIRYLLRKFSTEELQKIDRHSFAGDASS